MALAIPAMSRAIKSNSKQIRLCCSDCYFRREGLCAIPGEQPCPTFRAAAPRLTPPSQAPLVFRTPAVAGPTAVAAA
jgi:hypothetical protein